MKLRYVVVDDAPFIRELVKGVLSGLGHLCVGEASDGKEALSLITNTLPDFIVLDLVMPRKTGVAVAEDIRNLWPEGKIVACTTLEKDCLSPQQMKSIDVWILKPFTAKDFEASLNSLFKKEQEESA